VADHVCKKFLARVRSLISPACFFVAGRQLARLSVALKYGVFGACCAMLDWQGERCDGNPLGAEGQQKTSG